MSRQFAELSRQRQTLSEELHRINDILDRRNWTSSEQQRWDDGLAELVGLKRAIARLEDAAEQREMNSTPEGRAAFLAQCRRELDAELGTPAAQPHRLYR